MIFRDKTARFLATGCFVGNIPKAPGTLGTLAGLPLCFVLSLFGLPAAAVVTLIVILVAVLAAGNMEKQLGRKDPGCIVIDEIAGIIVTLLGLPFSPVTVITGFLLFRLLDIAKPFPISFLDQRLSGGVGIVADDVAAGVAANLLLQAGRFLVPGVFA